MGIIIHEDGVIASGNSNMERLDKEQEYLDYIEDHIKNVYTAYERLMVPLLDKNNISSIVSDEDIHKAVRDLYHEVKEHDASKFGDDEFDGYRAKYHPTAEEAAGDDEYQFQMNSRYEDCWKHHYENNDHHAEYWYDFEKGVARDMSLLAILHMICDWEAMSIKFGGTTLDWYENDRVDGKRKKEEFLSPRSKQILEDLMYNVFYK